MRQGYSSSELLDAVFDKPNGFKSFIQFIENEFNCHVVWDESSGQFFLIHAGRTSELFWDCEHCVQYHRPSNYKFCPHCGSEREACADSLVAELVEHGLLSVSDLPDDFFLKI